MDRTSATGPIKRYDGTTSGALAVYKYDSGQGAKISTYTTNPLWKVVDGPWRLFRTSRRTARSRSFPTRRCSGPIKPHISKFVELPFTSDEAELNALRSGAVDVGYLPYERPSRRSRP